MAERARPLLAPQWRAAAVWAAVLGALVALVLGIVVRHRMGTAFDRWVFARFQAHLSDSVAQVLIQLSRPVVSIVLLALAAVYGLVRRRVDIALLAVVPTVVDVLLVEQVLKPLVDRTLNRRALSGLPYGEVSLAYPSGHETAVACAALVLVLVVRQLPVPRAARAALIVLLGLWAVLAGVGLVRNYWHYPTDVLGAIALAVAVVFGSAVLLDRYYPRRGGPVSSPNGRGRASTARAA